MGRHATPGPWRSAAAVARARRRFHDLSFTHKVDKASPVLMQTCATGVHLKEGTITVRKSGKGQQEFLIIKMNDIIITSVTNGGGGGADGASENVSIAFAKVDMRVQAAEAGRIARCGHPFQIRPQGPEGRVESELRCGSR